MKPIFYPFFQSNCVSVYPLPSQSSYFPLHLYLTSSSCLIFLIASVLCCWKLAGYWICQSSGWLFWDFYHKYKHNVLLNVSLSLISAFYLSVSLLLHVVFRMTCTERFSEHTRPCSTRCSFSSAPCSASSSPGERKNKTGPYCHFWQIENSFLTLTSCLFACLLWTYWLFIRAYKAHNSAYSTSPILLKTQT